MRILVVLSFIAALSAQQPPPPGGGQRRPPPEPKNLKVLKIPAAELIPTMRAYSAALGVQCGHCHVQGNFAADDKPTKETARMMITMAQDINSKFPDAKVHVTCYTCHRGETEPKMAGAAPPAAPPPPPPPQ